MIISYFFEVISFSLLYSLAYELRFNQFPNFSIYQFYFLHFWILISYIFGRYTTEIHTKRVFLIYLIKTIFVSLFTISCFLTLIWFLGIKEEYFLYRSFLFPLLFLYSLLSFFIQIFISYLAKIQTRIRNKFIFFGSINAFDQTKIEIKISNLDIDLVYFDSVDYTLDRELDNFRGTLVEDYNCFNKYYSLLEKKINKSDFLVLSLYNWCEIYLQRFPPSLISFSNFLKSDFKVRKTSTHLRIKRFADIFVSLILILITAPLLGFASFLIILEDRGPILYRQIRNGYKERKFSIYKLRTMKVDSEKFGAQWSQHNDSRVTNIGKLLRVTRIDELPQLIAVLVGKMSLIGPRPERPEFDISLNKEINFYSKRYDLKPGLSGWAQVNYPYGASITDSANKLSYDLFYVKNVSFWLDLLIFIKTIKLIMNAKGSKPIKNKN